MKENYAVTKDKFLPNFDWESMCYCSQCGWTKDHCEHAKHWVTPKEVNKGTHKYMNTKEILDERQKTHGNFQDHADITQELKGVLKRNPDLVQKLTVTQTESIEMIFHKIGRILAGNPNFKDHWDDIAGYAQLIARTLE